MSSRGNHALQFRHWTSDSRLFLILQPFSVLKRRSRKSLPSSLFQTEESFLEIHREIRIFAPLENGDEWGSYAFPKVGAVPLFNLWRLRRSV
jgi:hypothetical protein